MVPVERSPCVLLIKGTMGGMLALRLTLEAAGTSCAEVDDGAAALRVFYEEQPDVVVLDLGVPDRSGWDLLATIREMSEVPVLLIASTESEDERLRGLRSQADSFLMRPFDREELQARVEGLLRRVSREEGSSAVFEDSFICFDRRGHRVTVLGVEVELTPTEFRMLGAFVERPGQALTHDQILDLVWTEGFRERQEVKVYVSYLRAKLARAAGVDPFETVRGIGYRYLPRVIPVDC